jgi:phosphoglycerate dehydrogenase-like enzyme
LDPAVLVRHLEGIDAVMASVENYSRRVLEASRLRAIARMGVGYDAVDVDAATDQGIAVTITPGTNEHSVAEMTMFLILAVMRGFPARYREVLTGKWTKRSLPRLAGQTLGLVGLGRIGKAVVPRAQGLGLKVIAYDPVPDTAFAAQNNVRLCPFDQLLAEADIVSLHLPALRECSDLINRQTLGQMKPGSVLINTARGGLVDEDALVEALRSGHLLGAGLDVFKTEPLPLDSPLLTLDNVFLSPHMAGLDHASLEAMGTVAARCIADLYQGRWPEGCVVNPQVRAGWKW